MTTDSELLGQFARLRSEQAFAELVRRHVNLVYSTALRRAGGDVHLAQDVAQTVFSDLARKAGSLSRRQDLTGWLYTSAHYAAAKAVRTESRRRQREALFMREPLPESTPEADWETIRPMLDDVMHELKAVDREAILLRHFENRSFAEVGQKLGVNENAARMRVERALEKLRALFLKRGVATSTALTSILSAHAVQTAPAHLAAALATTSMAAAPAGAALTLLNIMTATKLKISLGALVAAGATTVMVLQHQSQEKLRLETESLRQQLAQLQAENEDLANRLAREAHATNALPDDQFRELLRLRGEVGVLRRQTNELGATLAKTRKYQPRNPYSEAGQDASALPEDYPRTPDGATKGIFDTWMRGDWANFFANYGEPGVPREMYDQMFNDPVKSNYFTSFEVVSIGEPTNSFGPNMWFVPYKIRFKNGTEKEHRLHVAQDPRTQRWYFKGGF